MKKLIVFNRKGSGLWGGIRCQFRIGKLKTSVSNFDGSNELEIEESIIYFKRAGIEEWELRKFTSTKEMADFLSTIEDLRVENCFEEFFDPHVLQGVLGRQLSAVTFVMDYLQLDFDGHRLSCYNWPILHTEKKQISYRNAGYRDQLCALIETKVIDVGEWRDLGVVITFDCKVRLSIPLVAVNTDAPEALHYESSGRMWYVWNNQQ